MADRICRQLRCVGDGLAWKALAYRGCETQGEIRLLHQWIPLEVLAARWARQTGRDRIVDEVAFEALEASVRGWARQSLGKPERAELYEKVPELARRPAKWVLIDYLAVSFLPYPAQPVGEHLSAVVSRSLKARNVVVHDGAMDFDSVGGTPGAWRDLMKISAITSGQFSRRSVPMFRS